MSAAMIAWLIAVCAWAPIAGAVIGHCWQRQGPDDAIWTGLLWPVWALMWTARLTARRAVPADPAVRRAIRDYHIAQLEHENHLMRLQQDPLYAMEQAAITAREKVQRAKSG
jgi:hypothetical protein